MGVSRHVSGTACCHCLETVGYKVGQIPCLECLRFREVIHLRHRGSHKLEVEGGVKI
jgi:hypothetical protein